MIGKFHNARLRLIDMKTTTIRAERRANGQFSHGFEKMCTCGRPKGVHDAEAPFAFGDMVLETLPTEHPNHGNDCDGFRLDRKAGR